jgi:hypothetical protein
MTNNFRIVQINSQAEIERYGLRQFAAEFGHKPVGLPILLFFHQDELVAYVEVRSTPLLHLGVHPKLSSRTFLEGGRLLCAIVRERFPNGFVIYDYRSALFKPEQMKHLGFVLSPFQFFEPKQETSDGS